MDNPSVNFVIASYQNETLTLSFRSWCLLIREHLERRNEENQNAASSMQNHPRHESEESLKEIYKRGPYRAIVFAP